MKKINKTISLLSLVGASSILLSPLLASCSKGVYYQECHILDINDVHGAMAGYGEDVVDVGSSIPGCLRIAREVVKIKQQFPNTVLLSGGDENSGECWSVCDHGGTTYPILKAMGVRYAAVGNHAFEWGLDDLATGRYDRLGRTNETEGKYFVASNILTSNEYQTKKWCVDPQKGEFIDDFTTWMNLRVNWADPYKILNIGPATICLIGLATQNTLVDGNKRVTSNFSFIDYNASIRYSKYLALKELGEEKFNQIDSFILLTHCDSDYTNNILSGEAPTLAGMVDSDVDAIISAHSHKVGTGRIWNNILNKPVWVAQGGNNGKYLVDTKLLIDPKAAPGKRLHEISMSTHKIPIPATFEEAQQEWIDLQKSEDPALIPITDAYAQQKAIVEEKVSETITEVNLDKTIEGETQKDKTGKPFDGYYNGLIDSGVKIGHEYYDCKSVLDHFGAWACRALMLGYAIGNWEAIQEGNAVIPSVGFLSQDSLPTNLKNGSVKLRNMFAMQPYDNYVQVGYVDIFQMANIINYCLAGNPEIGKLHGGHGFSYTEKYQFEPDLCYYNTTNDAGTAITQTTQVAYNIKDDNGKPVINSGYVCGVMPFYGIRMNLQKITDDERKLKFENPVTGIVTPVYDSSAEYRVATSEHTIDGKTVILPQLWVYDGFNDGKGVKWGSMDRSDDPSCWKDAEFWYKAANPTSGEEVKLIPVLYNSFNYSGGNTQTRMFKQYAQYNILNKGIQFYTEETPETVRDFMIMFGQNSTYATREWAQYTIPTNFPWSQIDGVLVKKLN